MTPIFITGIGTGVGKTVAAAIVTEALQADYWKPVQTGIGEGTDSEWVRDSLTNPLSKIHREAYSLKLPASPHIAAKEEDVTIRMETILGRFGELQEGAAERPLVIEGAGGLLVPLNDNEFMLDLVKALHAKTILVSRNYLGSINHSLLSAQVCLTSGLKIAGWIFNGQHGGSTGSAFYLHYEEEIAGWSGIPAIASLPWTERPDREFIREQAERIRPLLEKALF